MSASLSDCIARCAFAARLAAMLGVFRAEGAASLTALTRAVDLCARVEADGVREEADGACEEADSACEEAAGARGAAAPDRGVVPAARAVFVFDCAVAAASSSTSSSARAFLPFFGALLRLFLFLGAAGAVSGCVGAADAVTRAAGATLGGAGTAGASRGEAGAVGAAGAGATAGASVAADALESCPQVAILPGVTKIFSHDASRFKPFTLPTANSRLALEVRG